MAGHTENTIVIDAPLPFVWDVTNALERWTDLFTEYAQVQILERRGDTVRFRLTMHPDENGRVWSWVSERTMDAGTRSVTAHRVEPGPFEYMRLRWNYEDVAGATRMTWIQDFAMRPDAPIDDDGMVARINANSKVQMDVIRAKVEAAARALADGTADKTLTTVKAPRSVAVGDVPVNRRRGGELRVLLSPNTVGSTSGFMGVATLSPGERITEHYHPYSEEFLHLVRGTLTVDLDGEPVSLRRGEALYIPIGAKHRLRNTGDEEAHAVFHLSPLAPRPDLGHVDTEVHTQPETAPSAGRR